MKDVVTVTLHWLSIQNLVFYIVFYHPVISREVLLLCGKYTILPIGIETFSLPYIFS